MPTRHTARGMPDSLAAMVAGPACLSGQAPVRTPAPSRALKSPLLLRIYALLQRLAGLQIVLQVRQCFGRELLGSGSCTCGEASSNSFTTASCASAPISSAQAQGLKLGGVHGRILRRLKALALGQGFELLTWVWSSIVFCVKYSTSGFFDFSSRHLAARIVTAAHVMLARVENHKAVCGPCARLCRDCARSCEGLDGMEDCARACKECANLCDQMAA